MPDSPPGITASQAAGVLVKRSENRSDEETRTIRRLKKIHRTTERCCSLFEEFARMLRDKGLNGKSRLGNDWRPGPERRKRPASPS